MIEANEQPILEGNLADFDLVEVLQVLSMSRQYSRVEVFDGKRAGPGAIHIKSGKVVLASHRTCRGRAAFFQLLRHRHAWFRVFRLAMPALIPEPLGSLSSLIMEALATPSQPSAPASAKSPRSADDAMQARAQPRAAAQSDASARRQSGFHAKQPAKPPRIIGVASPKGGSGKTTVSLNLALSLARRQQCVILVDGDVNGDLLSSLDARSSVQAGVFDVLTGGGLPGDALRKTVVRNLQILPAVGRALPKPELAFSDCRDGWRQLLKDLAERADVVIVDTPAGMLGVTYQILSSCTHVLGVLQAEVIAQRSFTMFADCIALLPQAERPKVLGVFLNMLQLRHQVSIEVLGRACELLPKDWLFETAIPRHPAFLDASAAGIPLHLYDPQQPPAVTWLFDTLATEVMERLALPGPSIARARTGSFLA